MSGSLKFFVYTDDDGNDWAIKRDESNMESVNGGTQDYLNTGTAKHELPRNIKPRALKYQSEDQLTTRTIVALTPTIYDAIINGDVGAPRTINVDSPIPGDSNTITLNLKSAFPERIRLPYGFDTAQDDGDAT